MPNIWQQSNLGHLSLVYRSPLLYLVLIQQLGATTDMADRLCHTNQRILRRAITCMAHS